MTSSLYDVLRPYRATAAAVVALTLAGAWPSLIAPVAHVYIALCERYLVDAPAGHHYPPLVVAFVAPIVLTCVGITIVALARQFIGQRQIDQRAARQPDAPSDTVLSVVRRLRLTGRVCYVADPRVYAFCSGLLRPRIFLSRGLVYLLTLDELEAVLRHEARHMKRRDPLRFFVSDLGRFLAPFFPIITTLTVRFRINAELEADRASLASMPVTTLASALVKVMRAVSIGEERAVISALSPTDARVEALLGRPVVIPLARRDVIVSLSFAVWIAILLGWLATQPVPLPPSCSNCSFF